VKHCWSCLQRSDRSACMLAPPAGMPSCAWAGSIVGHAGVCLCVGVIARGFKATACICCILHKLLAWTVGTGLSCCALRSLCMCRAVCVRSRAVLQAGAGCCAQDLILHWESYVTGVTRITFACCRFCAAGAHKCAGAAVCLVPACMVLADILPSPGFCSSRGRRFGGTAVWWQCWEAAPRIRVYRPV
jgi:hypothetical protein